MAGRGPARKPARQRDRDTAELRILHARTGVLSGKALPLGVLPDGQKWHPRTRALWNSLRTSPLLAEEPELGWQFLIDTALLHHTMWTQGRLDLGSELRLRVAKFGATPEDRLRLKVKIVPPIGPVKHRPASGADDATVTQIDSRRARLTEQ